MESIVLCLAVGKCVVRGSTDVAILIRRRKVCCYVTFDAFWEQNIVFKSLKAYLQGDEASSVLMYKCDFL